MNEIKKEEMKNWLETGIRETNEKRLAREKKSLENFEKKENLIFTNYSFVVAFGLHGTILCKP